MMPFVVVSESGHGPLPDNPAKESPEGWAAGEPRAVLLGSGAGAVMWPGERALVQPARKE